MGGWRERGRERGSLIDLTHLSVLDEWSEALAETIDLFANT